MATDLAGFERAYRLRSTADDQLLAQIFGTEELSSLRTSNPNLIETARAYFPHLTSSTYDRLVREPDSLRYEKDRCEREMEQLAVQNYGAFISNAKVTTKVQQELVDIQQQLDEMVEAMAPVQESIESFQTKATDLSVRRASLRNVKEQHSTILELLELPQLLDACIRNQMYDESLELLAYCNNMFQAYEARGDEIPVLQALCEQVASQKANLQSSLVAQLKTDIHLPACVRVMGFLRRLQRHSEDELRQLFITHRGAFLEGHRLQVEALRGNRGSVVTALRNAADLLRTHVFDIGMQYKALFAQEDGPLCAWLTEQIMWLTEILRVHVLPPSRQASQADGRGVAAALRSSTGARIDAPALATVLRQCLHASSTLKRLGGNFFPAVAGIFEARMEYHVCEMLDIALLTFHAELGRYDWVASTALAGASGASGGAGGAAAGDGGAAHGGVAWLHPQALELTRHRPLAVLCNDLVQMFNELRQCTLFGLRAPVVNHCNECFTGAVNVLRSVRGSQQLQGAKATEFSRLCQHFARILTPLVSSHLEAIFGAGTRLDATAIVTAMTPDLLPSSELEVELPVDGASWDTPGSKPPPQSPDGSTAAEPAAAKQDAAASEPAANAGVPNDPQLTSQTIGGLLADRSQLRQTIRQSMDASASQGSLDLPGLQALCAQLEGSIGVPAAAFGELPDTFVRFDFNGNGRLDSNEVYACVKHCLVEHRKALGGAPAPQVPSKTPAEAGYAVVRVLASGGQGEAALVKDASGTEVVLKTYSRENQNAGGLEELLDEAEHMRRVGKHDHVAHCIEIFQDDRNLYMVSAPNYGGDWASIQARATEQGVALTEAWYKSLFRQAFEGLASMHQHALMHCDVKEPNIMLRDADVSSPHVVLIDLGLSQALLAAGQGVCGTPGYIPPETWDTGKWFPRGDVFSLGVACAQLLTSKVPREGAPPAGLFTEGCQSLQEVTQATKERQPALDLASPQSPELLDVLRACLEKSRDSRPRGPQVLAMPWFQAP